MRKHVLVAGLLAAVATLTACGQTAVSGTGSAAGGGGAPAPAASGDASPAAKPAVAFGDSAAASLKAGTAKMSTTMEADDGTQKTTVSTGTGAIDFANHRSTLQMDMSGAQGAGAGAKIVYVMDGAIEYMQMGMGDDAPAPWIKVDLSKLTGQNGAIDYSNYLSLLNGVADSSVVGSDTIRGTDATHYRVTVDPKKVLEKNPDLKQFYDSLAKLAPNAAAGSDALKPMPYDIWISKDGLLERVRAVTATTAQNKSVNATTTIEFYDYGKPVEIKVPTPEEVKGN